MDIGNLDGFSGTALENGLCGYVARMKEMKNIYRILV
jgi:hypothetical protein